MGNFISGNIVKIIYESNSGPYKVGIFRVRETNDKSLESYLNKNIGFTGSFNEINSDVDYIFYGNLVSHPKYGIQYNVDSFEIKPPSDKDSLVLYLSSGMFPGIGEKTAKRIVDKFGLNTIDTTKNDYPSVATVSGMTITKARRMHDKIMENELNQELILKLNEYGFTIKEAIELTNTYGKTLFDILENNIYMLIEEVPFDKLDRIFLMNHNEMNENRIMALITHNIEVMCYESGDTLINCEELFIKLKRCFIGEFTSSSYLSYLHKLLDMKKIVIIDDMVGLRNFYDTENEIIKTIFNINKIKETYKDEKINKLISAYEKRNNIVFNDEQKNAIKGAIKNNFYIITGGPGTGKTTIIKAVVDILKDLTKLNYNDIALLAPTGRASKRIAESVGAQASTIHKFLKWNKETGAFSVDEYNKSSEKIVIVDEASMIDIFLFTSLLRGLRNDVKLILVGDKNQLPSIGPGDLLNDLLAFDKICKTKLETIYRVKDGSYIIDLANDIKDYKHFDSISNDYSDFKFIESSDTNIKTYLTAMCEKTIERGINIENFQVLAPMYKGLNGIDALNELMANIFNSKNEKYKIGDKYYRINDKVIQLVNDVDNNVFNGDIGYIENIYTEDGKTVVEINYMGNTVTYRSGEYDKFNLAYAISIHKSQGSEYDNVVIILAHSFNRMFYNKLIYTAVTRAKKSLVILGSLDSLNKSIETTYSTNRNTYLKVYNNKK